MESATVAEIGKTVRLWTWIGVIAAGLYLFYPLTSQVILSLVNKCADIGF